MQTNMSYQGQENLLRNHVQQVGCTNVMIIKLVDLAGGIQEVAVQILSKEKPVETSTHCVYAQLCHYVM